MQRHFCLTLILFLLPLLACGTTAWSQEMEGNAPLIDHDTAQPQVIPGQLPGERIIVPGEPSEVELKEANSIQANCAMNARDSSFYDCDCIAMNFLQQRMLDPRDGNDRLTAQAFLIENARKACPNTAGIAGLSYNRCMTWAPRMRRDYEEFCTCYANDYARRFSHSPTSNLQGNQWMMEVSMSRCNVGKPVLDNILRTQRIEELKRQGIYESLFPSAKGLNQPIIPADPNAAKTPQTMQQRLSTGLLVPDSAPRRTAP